MEKWKTRKEDGYYKVYRNVKTYQGGEHIAARQYYDGKEYQTKKQANVVANYLNTKASQ